MSEYNFTVESGSAVRLPTAGKYCDRDIVVTATGGDYNNEDGLIKRTITEYTNDRITSIGQYAFYRNSTIKSISFTLVTTISQYAFGICASLANINFPSLKTLGSYSFQSCTSLKSVEFPALTKMNTAPFTGCSNLTQIILSGSTICELGSTNSLSGTPIANGTGFVYVPDELVESYKAESSWKNYVAQIKPKSELYE